MADTEPQVSTQPSLSLKMTKCLMMKPLKVDEVAAEETPAAPVEVSEEAPAAEAEAETSEAAPEAEAEAEKSEESEEAVAEAPAEEPAAE